MPINVQLSSGNFSLGPDAGFFYSLDDSVNGLIKVEADGTVVDIFPISRSQLRNPVLQLHYDGTFFWSLELLPSNLGIVIKKWRLSPFKTFIFPNAIPVELRWQDELTLISNNLIRWDSKAFAVQHYHRFMDSSATREDTFIKLDDVSNLSAGDLLQLGPSSFTGFSGNEEAVIVSSIDLLTKRVFFSKPGGLENSYITNDPVDFNKSLYIFNEHSFTGQEDFRGAFVEFQLPNKQQIRSDSGKKYGGVGAADFDKEILSWSKQQQILQLNVFNPTFDLQASIEANMVEQDLITVIEMFDMITELDSNVILKLQRKETIEDIGVGVFSTITFPNGKHNFQTQTTLPVINSIGLLFPITRFTTPSPAGDSFPIQAIVRDQFNFPSFGETIQFSASLNSLSAPGSPGTLSSLIGITNASGIASTLYTPSATSSDILVDIEAQVL